MTAVTESDRNRHASTATRVPIGDYEHEANSRGWGARARRSFILGIPGYRWRWPSTRCELELGHPDSRRPPEDPSRTYEGTHVAGLRRRGSPQTVETSVVVIMARAGWPCCARVRSGQVSGLPAFPAHRGGRGPRGQGRPAEPSPAGRCAAPWRPGWRPRTLSGHSRASGGEAVSFAWPAQRARRAHAASFPASDRS
jgi:hypothetical protein